MDRWTDQQTYFPIEIQVYISAMFLGFPDEHRGQTTVLEETADKCLEYQDYSLVHTFG